MDKFAVRQINPNVRDPSAERVKKDQIAFAQVGWFDLLPRQKLLSAGAR